MFMTISNDFRAKLQAKPGAIQEIYGIKNDSANLLGPIARSNGMIMPYTPAIQVNQAVVDYAQYNLPQTNFDYFAFSRRSSPTFSVTAPYTAQDQEEARYMLAVIHFLRTVTMSYYGIQNKEKRGIPPPVLLFSAYGPYMYEKVPVLVRNVSFGLDQEIDYVPAGSFSKDISVANNTQEAYRVINGIPYSQEEIQQMNADATEFNDGEYGTPMSAPQSTTQGTIDAAIAKSYVPTVLTIFMDLVYAPIPSKARDEFNLDDFRKGRYLGDPGTGGFI
jgi:hypothetical protein